MLSGIEASQRAIAETLGVGVATINRDINPTVPNGTIKGKTPIDNEVVIIDTVPNETQEPSGQEVAKMVEDKIIAEAKPI